MSQIIRISITAAEAKERLKKGEKVFAVCPICSDHSARLTSWLEVEDFTEFYREEVA